MPPIVEGGRLCEAHLQRQTCRNQDGRFVVRLPVRSQVHQLGDSFKQAERRMHLLGKRFQRQPQLRKVYVKFVYEYADLDHMEPSPTNQSPLGST
jgi:hypothetical protein